MPPCMIYLYDNLKLQSHLKHQGRLQLGLFLKSAGLSKQDAITFWKKSFAQKITSEDFERNYAYNIRHNYGDEGKHVSYSALSCKSCIDKVPSNGE